MSLKYVGRRAFVVVVVAVLLLLLALLDDSGGFVGMVAYARVALIDDVNTRCNGVRMRCSEAEEEAIVTPPP